MGSDASSQRCTAVAVPLQGRCSSRALRCPIGCGNAAQLCEIAGKIRFGAHAPHSNQRGLQVQSQIGELRGPLCEENKRGEQSRELFRLRGVVAQQGDALLGARFDIRGERGQPRAQRDAFRFEHGFRVEVAPEYFALNFCAA